MLITEMCEKTQQNINLLFIALYVAFLLFCPALEGRLFLETNTASQQGCRPLATWVRKGHQRIQLEARRAE